MKSASYTHKQIINHLNQVVNNTFGGAAVPLHLAEHIQAAGRAIGLRICSGLYNVDNNTIALYLD